MLLKRADCLPVQEDWYPIEHVCLRRVRSQSGNSVRLPVQQWLGHLLRGLSHSCSHCNRLLLPLPGICSFGGIRVDALGNQRCMPGLPTCTVSCHTPLLLPVVHVVPAPVMTLSTTFLLAMQTVAQTQGLQPYNGTACATTCAITIDGLTGSSVAADAQGSSSVCLPISETSLLNRFGHTVNTTAGGQACVINTNDQPFIAAQFSCFCLFTAPATATARHHLL